MKRSGKSCGRKAERRRGHRRCDELSESFCAVLRGLRNLLAGPSGFSLSLSVSFSIFRGSNFLESFAFSLFLFFFWAFSFWRPIMTKHPLPVDFTVITDNP